MKMRLRGSSGHCGIEAQRPDPFSDATPEHEALMGRFVRALNRSKRFMSTRKFEVEPYEVGIIHGLLLLAAVHPGVAQMSKHTHEVISKFRVFARKCWRQMGLSAEDVEMLDTLREQNAEPEGDLVPFKDRIVEALAPVLGDSLFLEDTWAKILAAVAHTWRLRDVGDSEWNALSRSIELSLVSAHCRGRAGATLEIDQEVRALNRQVLGIMRLDRNTGTEGENEKEKPCGAEAEV